MASNSISISAETSAGTVQALQAAIDARTAALKSTTQDSAVAAAITILRSLKASTKVAPPSPTDNMIRVVATDMFGGLYRDGGTTKVCARVGSHYGPKSHIRPAIGFTPGSGAVFKSRVYAVYTLNPNDKFSENVNAPAQCWYVLCESEGQAKKYAEGSIAARRGLAWMLKKERGMAKAAIGMAQAKASTKSRVMSREDYADKSGMSAKASSIAYDAGQINVTANGYGSGDVSVSFYDQLKYSLPASGKSSLDAAIAKAANSMLGAYGSPEIKAELENLKGTNPEAKFIDIFKRRFSA